MYLKGSQGELLVMLHAGHFTMARTQSRHPLQHLLCFHLQPQIPLSAILCW